MNMFTCLNPKVKNHKPEGTANLLSVNRGDTFSIALIDTAIQSERLKVNFYCFPTKLSLKSSILSRLSH